MSNRPINESVQHVINEMFDTEKKDKWGYYYEVSFVQKAGPGKPKWMDNHLHNNFADEEEARAFAEEKGGKITKVPMGGPYIVTGDGPVPRWIGFINLGSVRDVRGVYSGTARTLPELREEGKKAYDKRVKETNQSSNDYYHSRPWL